ncbi:Histone-lysine N-methyltransferase ash1 [Halotydeus destructor]|nr:Histone-lysine N-methyltransferase ash1 [Halotydeus destructor]
MMSNSRDRDGDHRDRRRPYENDRHHRKHGKHSRRGSRSHSREPERERYNSRRNDFHPNKRQDPVQDYENNYYVPPIGNPQKLNDQCTVRARDAGQAMDDFFNNGHTRFRTVPEVVPEQSAVYVPTPIPRPNQYIPTPIRELQDPRVANRGPVSSHQNPVTAWDPFPAHHATAPPFPVHSRPTRPSRGNYRGGVNKSKQWIFRPRGGMVQPQRPEAQAYSAWQPPPIPLGALLVKQPQPSTSFAHRPEIPLKTSPPRIVDEEKIKETALNADTILKNLESTKEPVVLKRQCMVCRKSFTWVGGDQLCNSCRKLTNDNCKLALKSTTTLPKRIAKGPKAARKKSPVILLSSDEASASTPSPPPVAPKSKATAKFVINAENEERIRGELVSKRANVARKIKILENDAFVSIAKKRFRSATERKADSRLPTTIRAVGVGPFCHKVKTLRRPSPPPQPKAMLTDSDGMPVHRNTYKIGAESFPAADDLCYEPWKHGTLLCLNESCKNVFKKPKREKVLCQDCRIWNHIYCIDYKEYNDNRFGGHCIFCRQLKKCSEFKELEMDISEVDIKELEGEDVADAPEFPMSKLLFNVKKNDKHHIKIGDVVYVRMSEEEESEVIIYWVYYCLRDALGRAFIAGTPIMLPHQIKREKDQTFYAHEVFPTLYDISIQYVPVSEIVGFACMLHRKDYFQGRPRGFVDLINEDDTYVYEFYYHEKESNHYKAVDKKGHSEFNIFNLNTNKYAWKKFDEEIPVFKRNLSLDDRATKDEIHRGMRIKGDLLEEEYD